MSWLILERIATLIVALSALGGLIISSFNYRKISEVHVQINSRMDLLLQTTGLLGKAEGRAERDSENPPVDNNPR